MINTKTENIDQLGHSTLQEFSEQVDKIISVFRSDEMYSFELRESGINYLVAVIPDSRSSKLNVLLERYTEIISSTIILKLTHTGGWTYGSDEIS